VVLERWVSAHGTPQSLARRARVILLAAPGESNLSIARAVGVGRPTVIACRRRFCQEGPDGLTRVRPGRGRKAQISPDKVAQIVEATLHTKPPGDTHSSCRSMAKAQGVSPATVQRIWDAHNLKPLRVETFKLSNDKRFLAKLERRRRAVSEPAREGDRPVRGREEPRSRRLIAPSRRCR